MTDEVEDLIINYLKKQKYADSQCHINTEYHLDKKMVNLIYIYAAFLLKNEYEGCDFDICSYFKDNLKEFLTLHYKNMHD